MNAESHQSQADRETDFERAMCPLLPGLRASSLRLTRHRADAEDLVQETVMRAWRFWDRFELGSNRRAWIHRILRNTFASRYRRRLRDADILALHARQAQQQFQLEVDEPANVRESISAELASGLSALPPHMHAVLWAVAVEELSYRETAERVGCPIGTVMSRLHRAKDVLRPRLACVATRECA